MPSNPTSVSDDAPADAAATDPVRLGWMQGTPPPPQRTIAFADGSFMRFPRTRWSFSHWRELVPTVEVGRGDGPVSALERAERTDIDAVEFTPLGSAARMSWQESLAANYTDAIVVLHRSRIVYERYFGAGAPGQPHIAFSVTKSFAGLLATALIIEGALDPSQRISHYVPELGASGFADATLGQVLDMTTALASDEQYEVESSRFHDYARATGMEPRAGHAGAGSDCEYLSALPKSGEHGAAFVYRSVNTDALAWVMARVTGAPFHVLLSERLWSRLGMEAEAYLQVDSAGTPLAFGTLNARARDLARFGQMILQEGSWHGRQIVPATAIAEIRRGADRGLFAGAGYATLPGWSYHNQWWVAHDAHGVFMARGIHGQALYIDPAAQLVIARFASHPRAGNVNLDPTSLPAYRALAAHLAA